MPSEKSRISIWDGPDAGVIGDIIYYNGTDWVRLHPGNEGEFLTVVDVDGGNLEPRWMP